MPALMGVVGGSAAGGVLGLGIIPEHSLLDSCTRLSISLEESVFKVSVSSSSQSSRSNSSPHMTLDELRAINKYAESTKSLSYLPQVANVAARGGGPGALVCARAAPRAARSRTPTLRSRSLSSLVK